MRLVAVLLLCLVSTPAFAQPTIDDLAFLEGHWRGGDDSFVFEEIWAAPEGGVMTAMARGVAGEELRVLEYIIISEEDTGLVMRFKHYGADYKTWDGEDEPITLTLTSIDGPDALFASDPPSHSLVSMRYWMPSEDTLRMDAKQIENGKEGGFSLVFTRID